MRKEIVEPLYNLFVGESISERYQTPDYMSILENDDEYYSNDGEKYRHERPLISKDKDGNDFIEFDPCDLDNNKLDRIFEMKKEFKLDMKMEGMGMHNDTFSVTLTLKE